MQRRSAAERAVSILGGEREAVDRLVALYRGAPAPIRRLGAEWYAGARWEVCRLAESAGLPPSLVADVVAVLSPRCRWDKNIAAASSIINDPDAMPDGVTFRNALKAWRLLQGGDRADIVRGPKVTRFARACNPTKRHDGTVVIDTWMVRALLGREPTESETKCITSPSAYHVAERLLQAAADRLGVARHKLQATVWVVVRGSAN